MVTQSNNQRWLRNSIICGTTVAAFILSTAVGNSTGVVLAQGATAEQLQSQIAKQRGKKNTEALAAALYQLAQHYFDIGDTEKAVPLIRESKELDKAAGRPTGVLHYALGLALFSQAKKSGSKESLHYDAAISEFELARAAFAKESPDQIVVVMSSMGMVEGSRRNFAAAIEHLKAAAATAEANKQPKAASEALSNLSSIARAKGDINGALQYQEQAVQVLAKSNDDAASANALCRLGEMQKVMHRFDESITTYEQVLKLEDALPEINRSSDLTASAHFGIAECLWSQHRLQEASLHYQQAIDALKDDAIKGGGASDLWIRANIGLGIAQADLNELDKAEASHVRAFERAKQINRADLQVEAAIQLSFDSLMRGRVEQALERLLAERKLVEKPEIDLLQRGSYSILVGRCYRNLGQTSAALKFYANALREYESAKDPARQAEALSNIAVAYLDSKRPAEFEMYSNRASDLFNLIKDERGVGTIEYNKAQYELMCGNHQAALALYDSALSKLQSVHDPLRSAGAMRGKGFALLYNEKADEAAKTFEQALKLAQATGDLESQWDCNLGLGRAYRKMGQPQQAVGYLQTAVELVEKERQQLTRDSFKTHNLDFRRACYLELADAYLAEGKSFEALEIAEKGKARAFLDLLSNRQSREMDVAFAAPRSDTLIGALPNVPLNLATTSAEKGNLIASAALPGTRGVEVVPRAHSYVEPTLLSPVTAKAPDIAEIKELVKKRNSTCVEYYLFSQKMVIWVIKPDLTVTTVTVDVKRNALAAEVQGLHDVMLTQPKNQQELEKLATIRQKHLQSLHSKLMAPIEQYLPKTPEVPVTIVPDGELFMVPYAALMAPDNSYVAEKHTLSYTPAIGVLRSTQQLASDHKENRKLLAFGNPASPLAVSMGLPELPYAEKEVKNIAQLFGADNTNLKTGTDATKSAFARFAPENSCIHLATHGLVDEEHPMMSSLVLAPYEGDDGMLTVGDIMSLKDIKANLIVLSACQTGRGKITGDGVVGLSRAFIIAGTPSVIVSQWNVDDVMTEYLMRNFYQEYLAGKPKSQALRDAQMAAIKVLERGLQSSKGGVVLRANPRFWAAFQIIGEQK